MADEIKIALDDTALHEFTRDLNALLPTLSHVHAGKVRDVVLRCVAPVDCSMVDNGWPDLKLVARPSSTLVSDIRRALGPEVVKTLHGVLAAPWNRGS